MKQITEGVAVVDEEEGSLDSFSNVGAPSPQHSRLLQGLDRELSTKFGPTSPYTAGDDNNSTNSSGRQAGPSFTDFLQAQKKLQSRRRLSQTDLLLQRSASNTSDTTGINSSRRLYGSDIGTNIAVASAVAKLRAKAKESAEQQTSPTANQSTQPQTTSAAKQSAFTSNKQITSFGWDEIFTELQNIDEDGHFLDHHTHIVPWYSPPIQRQRWGEDSVLPHVNWGDLFFDLFYVAMVRLLLVLYVVYVGVCLDVLFILLDLSCKIFVFTSYVSFS